MDKKPVPVFIWCIDAGGPDVFFLQINADKFTLDEARIEALYRIINIEWLGKDYLVKSWMMINESNPEIGVGWET